MRARTAWKVAIGAACFTLLGLLTAAQSHLDDGAVLHLLNATLAGSRFTLRDELFLPQARDSFRQALRDTVPDTVPAGVECKKIKHCDKHNVCAIVCERGSVVVDPWLQRALKLQRKLAYQRNFCHANLPGSHNTAINMADVRFVYQSVATEGWRDW
jgi:hypothetical protein